MFYFLNLQISAGPVSTTEIIFLSTGYQVAHSLGLNPYNVWLSEFLTYYFIFLFLN